MNERIKQLAEQAKEYARGFTYQHEVFEKKFAELIVRECAEVITETRWHLPPTQQQIAIGIKEHFGVKE